MKTLEYIDATKKKLGIESDYGLAKALGISKQQISNYRRLHVKPDAYACTKIAIVLNEDPAKVIAEISLEWETDEKRQGFWLNFLLRAAKQGTYILALVCTVFWWHAPVKDAMTMTSNSFEEKLVTYQPIMRSIILYITQFIMWTVSPVRLCASVTVTRTPRSPFA